MPINWKEFTLRVPIKAPAKSIYDAWTTQQGLESWFLRLARFTKPDNTIRPRNSHVEAGDKYKWLWHGYPDDTDENREILSSNGWDEVKFSFSGDCIVTVSIYQQDGETICQLTQQMPMDDIGQQQSFYVECGRGWTFYLANLKSILEGGNDLRNRNIALQQLIS